jgi:MFS superfamily sulfate permease-like transporter
MKQRLPGWWPRSVLTFAEGYDATAFSADLVAGVTVGLVALPLAMAFAIASGLTPQSGIYCAIITGFTNGIALVIASTQLKDLLGLNMEAPGSPHTCR